MANWQYYNLVTEEGFWLAQKGRDLEFAIKDLVSKKGWNTKLTSTTGDAGIDLICKKNEVQILVQAKGHSKPLGVAAIREAAGVKMAEKPDQMIVVCPKGFTKDSTEFADKTGIKLINASILVQIANDQMDLSDQ